MKYGTAPAFRHALEDRLKVWAGGDGARIARYRKRVVFDRFLARLVEVAAGDWVLKGGFALDLRLDDRARSTKDIDLAWRADENELLDVLIDAAIHDVGDFFTFTVERTDDPPERFGGAHRFRVLASLAGRPFETFVLDVGRTDDVVGAEILMTPNLLDFAGIAPVAVRRSRSWRKWRRSCTPTPVSTRVGGSAAVPRTSSTSRSSPSCSPWTPTSCGEPSNRSLLRAALTSHPRLCRHHRTNGARRSVNCHKPSGSMATSPPASTPWPRCSIRSSTTAYRRERGTQTHNTGPTSSRPEPFRFEQSDADPWRAPQAFATVK